MEGRRTDDQVCSVASADQFDFDRILNVMRLHELKPVTSIPDVVVMLLGTWCHLNRSQRDELSAIPVEVFATGEQLSARVSRLRAAGKRVAALV